MSSSDTVYDPTFGPWNTVQCTNTHLKLPLNEKNSNGTVVAFDIFPISGGTYPQSLFAFGNSENLAITLAVELGDNRLVYVYQNLPGWKLIATSAVTLTDSNL